MALVLALAGRPASGDGRDRGEDRYQFAKGLYARQQWDAAAEEFAAFLAQQPDHAACDKARFYLGEALVSMGEVRLASSVFERVPAETGARTPFQDRRVALTQIRRAQLAARRAHGAELFEAILPWLEGLFGDALTALRDEVLEGRVGEATRAVAARCARPWEPMVIGGGS